MYEVKLCSTNNLRAISCSAQENFLGRFYKFYRYFLVNDNIALAEIFSHFTLKSDKLSRVKTKLDISDVFQRLLIKQHQVLTGNNIVTSKRA